MFLLKILPSFLKELSKDIPGILFHAVNWTELRKEIPLLSHRIFKKEGHLEMLQKQTDFLSKLSCLTLLKPEESASIFTSKNSLAAKNPSHQNQNKMLGNTLLKIYFLQLFSPHGIFLDLRSHHFFKSPSDDSFSHQLWWVPSPFWTQMSSQFRSGILKVYEGFYLEDENLYYQGLEEIALLNPQMSHQEKTELGLLFKKQFGNALDEEMNFKLDHLKESIIHLSNFMVRKRLKISNDFLYLGIYLVTLYSTLEELNSYHPVKKIYLEAREYSHHKFSNTHCVS